MQEEGAKRLSDIFEQAQALPPQKRSAFLDQACAGNPALRAELRTLLAHGDAASGLLSRLGQAFRIPRLRTRDVTSGGLMLAPGTIVGHYEILHKLGGGGMGIVYKALDRRLGRLVALKFLPSDRSSNDEIRRRFELEAKAASGLEHVNICTIYEIAETSDHLVYISMAFCDGDTLEKKIGEGRIPIIHALDYVLQIGRGLACAHERRIVHRDVKPANILLTRDGVVKIVDFGIAKWSDSSNTLPGHVLGTAAYMSPEQTRGEAVDQRTDIWSMGVVFYEMLAGELPFKGDYVDAVLYAIRTEDPTPIGALVPGIPMQIAHVIGRMLEKRLNSRYQRMDELLADLTAIYERISMPNIGTSAAREELQPRLQDEPAAYIPFGRTQAQGPFRILVVDDEAEIEMLIRQQFQDHAHEWSFVFASDGLEALEKLEAHPEIALLLTDIRMPRMDGLTLLKRLHDMRRPIKTLVMSAYGDLEKIRVAMNGGAFDFVTKPIDFADLKNTMVRAREDLLTYLKAADAQNQLVAVKQELEVARRILNALRPPSVAKFSGVDVYGYTQTARGVSGDFYNYFAVGEDRVGFLVGEVASRGVSAALLAAMFQSSIRWAVEEDRSPGDCLSALNRFVLAEDFPNVSVSLFLAVLDVRTGTVSYSNAGQLPALILRPSGKVSPVSEAVDVPVWSERAHQYRTSRLSLQPNERLFLFTNGIPDAVDRHGYTFSSDRLSLLLAGLIDVSATELVRRVVREIAQFTEGSVQTDDFTALAVRYSGPSPADEPDRAQIS